MKGRPITGFVVEATADDVARLAAVDNVAYLMADEPLQGRVWFDEPPHFLRDCSVKVRLQTVLTPEGADADRRLFLFVEVPW